MSSDKILLPHEAHSEDEVRRTNDDFSQRSSDDRESSSDNEENNGDDDYQETKFSCGKAQYVIETESTILQSETEDEVAPYLALDPDIILASLCGAGEKQGQKIKKDLQYFADIGLLVPPSTPTCVLPGDSTVAASLHTTSPYEATSMPSALNTKDMNDLEQYSSEDNDEKLTRNTHGALEYSQFTVRLMRDKHITYLKRALESKLPSNFVSLDASRTWIVYWTIHGLSLLDSLPQNETLWNVIHFMKRCFSHVDGVALICNDYSGDKDGGCAAGHDESNINQVAKKRAARKLGGYGGGPGQMCHCATTYAAVLALCVIAGGGRGVDGPIPNKIKDSAVDAVDSVRAKLYAWFMSLRYTSSILVPTCRNVKTEQKTVQDGGKFGGKVLSRNETTATVHGRKIKVFRKEITGFRVHYDGEVDVRGTYTVIAIATLLDMLTPELIENVAEYVAACQTYEGGFSAGPNEGEAHGGYTFCAVAALQLLSRVGLCDKEALRGWLARRQMQYEGGFSGRSNKLVDGCYSFWQGSAMAILNLSESSTNPAASGLIERVLEVPGTNDSDHDMKGSGLDLDQIVKANDSAGGLMYDQSKLQRYILLCAQESGGGLRDKPSKPRDFYHSCYNLSGLSVAQHTLSECGIPVVFGDAKNVIQRTHPTINIKADTASSVISTFCKRYGPPKHERLIQSSLL